ncbi:neurofilament medium polypeptide-like [Anoplophora glabripennis]|uniref:neurofilament medium polypeptide-like n=1 Tax=Anoplophora glabripennis TaxID=217634 RepID=UPI0008746BAC|nr:neurofilament medium polypeptide-like [Anoplophora glabripennis]
MFALWYAALTYKEYKDVLWEKILPKKRTSTPAKETAVVCPLPPKRSEPSKIPIVEPPKSPRTPSPVPSNLSTPEYPLSPQATSTPIKRSPENPKPLEPPAKPPRSPSPHPIKSETLDDIEYEDEDEEEEEEASDVEEDDENSVISSSPRRAQLSNTVNEFINQEVNQPNSLRLNQTR